MPFDVEEVGLRGGTRDRTGGEQLCISRVALAN